MGREDETDEEVYHRYLRVRNQVVVVQRQTRSLSSPNVIPFEQWRDQLMTRRRQRELDTLPGRGDD